MSVINKILVANRGEIALRVMKTIRQMGLRSVAIFSEADRFSPHVKYADESVCIGPAPSSESYLKMDKIIEVCKKLKVDAIHPGYGFLSENSEFCSKVKGAGIIFIGPEQHAIEVMGSKLAAKNAVSKYNIPMVPGTEKAIDDVQEAKNIAKEIGYPILIKASAGGGGKGMRIVNKEDEFEEQMQMAVSEAISSFGDGAVFIEKYINSPKHIEIQVLGDTHGNIVYLFERECSVQRRHQKVIEEAPSPVVNDEMRKKMGEAAVGVAKACNYIGAGTVEFIVDEQLNFYFLEMNTRLQVEHPVTEFITGIDLVKEQIKIAEGHPISFSQKDLVIKGHSIELRVYAEDPFNNFLPDIGKLIKYKAPIGEGIRVDDGFEEGMEIPIFYDPMISKLIVHDENREKAITKLLYAIDNYEIEGIQNSLLFGKFVLNHPEFRNGKFDTHFVEKYFKTDYLIDNETENAAALFSAFMFDKEDVSDTVFSNQSNWFENRIN